MSQRRDETFIDNDTIGTVRTNERVVTQSAPVRDYGQDEFVEVKNRVQFGPIIAGVLTAIATLLILTVLGLAIGASAFEPREVGQSLGLGAAIWGILSAIIAFFVGGWVAAKTAAVSGSGSGLMVGAAILALLLWLAGNGVGALLGTLGSNIGDITNVVQQQGTSTTDVQAQAQQQIQQVDPSAAFNNVRDGAWGTLAGLVVPLVASALSGFAGQNRREDMILRVR